LQVEQGHQKTGLLQYLYLFQNLIVELGIHNRNNAYVPLEMRHHNYRYRNLGIVLPAVLPAVWVDTVVEKVEHM
jgi:hypothetical protein